MTKTIKVTTRFEDLHRWPDAPSAVHFLRLLHRHMFHVTVWIEVIGSDRELEFFIVQRSVSKIIYQDVKPMGDAKSCEMMAEVILSKLEELYPLGSRMRLIQVEVSEDGENGSLVNNYDRIN